MWKFCRHQRIKPWWLGNYLMIKHFSPLICEMKLPLLSWQNSPNDVIKSMTSTILIKFEKYWNVTHHAMSAAIVLDPRYKLNWSLFFPKIYGEGERSEIMRIRNMISEFFEEYKKMTTNEVPLQKRQPTTNVLEGGGFKTIMGVKFWDCAFWGWWVWKNRVGDYLAEKLLSYEEGFEILMWWKCNGSKFTIL